MSRTCCQRRRFGTDVLWPAAQRPQPLPCPRCGSPRVHELQLMPGLLAALDEGLAWMESHHVCGTGGTKGGALPSIERWTWLTVAVLTCNKSCGDGTSGWTVADEQLEMCLEH